jgi:hypothetical protein
MSPLSIDVNKETNAYTCSTIERSAFATKVGKKREVGWKFM